MSTAPYGKREIPLIAFLDATPIFNTMKKPSRDPPGFNIGEKVKQQMHFHAISKGPMV